MAFLRLKYEIQQYSWGSTTAIAELTRRPSPALKPEAELWLGTHPKGCSSIADQSGWVKLDTYIAHNPEKILGWETNKRFGGQLPFLLKVLAAAEPLSIQVHPTKDQAVKGFAKEQRLGVPLDSPLRNYRDDNHKPELIAALTPFTALRGFRPIPEIIQHTEHYCRQTLTQEIQQLADNQHQSGLQQFFISLLQLSEKRKQEAINEVLDRIKHHQSQHPEVVWIKTLHRYYSNDIGVLAPLILNLIVLSPGQAMFLPAGELHAYLQGVGIEIMANSDNVIRGGLTTKHIDIKELIKMLNFETHKISLLEPVAGESFEIVYPTSAAEFILSEISQPTQSSCYRVSSAEILLCIKEAAILSDNNTELSLQQGEAVFIPADTGEYHLKGNCRVIRARVPL